MQAQFIGWDCGAVGLGLLGMLEVWICSPESPVYFTRALHYTKPAESERRTSTSPNFITSQTTQAKAPLIIDLITLFHFPRYFLKCWTHFSLLLLLLRVKVLFLKEFLSLPPFSFSNALFVFTCLPVFSVLCEPYSFTQTGVWRKHRPGNPNTLHNAWEPLVWWLLQLLPLGTVSH